MSLLVPELEKELEVSQKSTTAGFIEFTAAAPYLLNRKEIALIQKHRGYDQKDYGLFSYRFNRKNNKYIVRWECYSRPAEEGL